MLFWLICCFGALPGQLVLAGVLTMLPKRDHWPQAVVTVNFSSHTAMPAVAQAQHKGEGKSLLQKFPLKHNTATPSNLPWPPWFNTSRVLRQGIHPGGTKQIKKILNQLWKLWSYQKTGIVIYIFFQCSYSIQMTFLYISFPDHEIKWSFGSTGSGLIMINKGD